MLNILVSLFYTNSPPDVTLYTNTSETTDSSSLYSITVVITAITFGMVVFSCVLLLAAICTFLCHHAEEEDTQKGE